MEQIPPGAAPQAALRPLARATLECLLVLRGKPPLDGGGRGGAGDQSSAVAALTPPAGLAAQQQQPVVGVGSTTASKAAAIWLSHSARVMASALRDRHASPYAKERAAKRVLAEAQEMAMQRTAAPAVAAPAPMPAPAVSPLGPLGGASGNVGAQRPY